MRVRLMACDEAVKVDDFLKKSMYLDEPLAMSVPSDCIPKAGKGFASAFASQGVTTVAENDDGEIIGVSLNDMFPDKTPNIYSFADGDNKFQKLFDYLQDESRVKEIAPDAMEVRMLSVCPSSRKQGVASALIEESVNVARNAGLAWVKMYCTSNYSSRLIAKKGWTLLHSKSYHDLKNMIPDLPIPPAPHTHVDLYIKATKD